MNSSNPVIMNSSKSVAAACPVCGAVLELPAVQLGLVVDCPDCAEVFRVAALTPLELVYAFDADEEPLRPQDERDPS